MHKMAQKAKIVDEIKFVQGVKKKITSYNHIYLSIIIHDNKELAQIGFLVNLVDI